MAKALTLKELGDLDAALKRAGIGMTKNLNVKLGQQYEPPVTTVSGGQATLDKPEQKRRGPKPKDKTDAPKTNETPVAQNS